MRWPSNHSDRAAATPGAGWVCDGCNGAPAHGRQLRDFIYAADADLLVRLLLSPQEGAFNIATGTATTVRSAIEMLADRRGGRALLRLGAIEPATGEPARLVADMTKVRTHLDWSAATSLAEGIDLFTA